jgi:hypothetical protein
MVDNMQNQGNKNVNKPKSDKDVANKTGSQNDQNKIQGGDRNK